jgi:predicted Holliday junction resolvase-like endonuclease
MNTVTFILIALAVVVILACVIYALYRDNKKLKQEKKALENELNGMRESFKQYEKYINEILKIKGQSQEIKDRIKEAKTDEEINAIIADIVTANNVQVNKD